MCAWNGHVLVGTDAATISEDDPLVVREIDAGRRQHRCLRCDAWLVLPTPTEPARPTPPTRDEITLPDRGRPLKSRYILRLIALTRAFNVLVLLLLLGGVVAVLVNQTALRDGLMSSASGAPDRDRWAGRRRPAESCSLAARARSGSWRAASSC